MPDLNKKIKVAKKYKIDPEMVPYTNIEYISGKTHKKVHLEPSMLHELRYGTPFEEEIGEPKQEFDWSAFIAGCLWTLAIAVIVWSIWG